MRQLLPREEYVEQAYLFKALAERSSEGEPVQSLLKFLRQEILATTKLPMAIDYLLAELNHVGAMSTAMRGLSHYFTAFQSFIIGAAENVRGRFDIQTALKVLEHEASFRADNDSAAALFFYQFETLCRNRLEYDHGLVAMSHDPFYDETWQRWIANIQHKIGIIDIADLVYVHSYYYVIRQSKESPADTESPDPVLFDEKEGRIALANRTKEPLFFFSALQRQLNYPEVPRPKRRDENEDIIPKLLRTVQQLETRLKLLEDEQRGKGIDLSQFFEKPGSADRP
ncbi:MAG: hypothetical protein AAF456_15795 [Planctomycetota bacterium]